MQSWWNDLTEGIVGQRNRLHHVHELRWSLGATFTRVWFEDNEFKNTFPNKMLIEKSIIKTNHYIHLFFFYLSAGDKYIETDFLLMFPFPWNDRQFSNIVCVSGCLGTRCTLTSSKQVLRKPREHPRTRTDTKALVTPQFSSIRSIFVHRPLPGPSCCSLDFLRFPPPWPPRIYWI